MELMPIQALAEAVRDALAGDPQPKNGQVRPIPDARSIRYYTTLGLVDRPAAMDGRTALYGAQHVRQLVAIKRLQAEGLSLAEIQARLKRAPGELGPRTKSRSSAFWKERPADPSAPPPSSRQARIPMIGIELGEVTLLFRPARTIDEADDDALRRAAAPLLQVLEARGLIAPLEAERE
jgi:DNA-binding transcriptional MerR regulator